MSYAQKKPSKANLQAQAKKIESQIQYNNKLLQETSKSKSANLNQLAILNNQINQRDRLIKTINSEIAVVNSDIQNYEHQITSLQRDIAKLKSEYTKLLIATQRHMNPSEQFMFVVASENFNQAYRRLKYFQQYSTHRKEQVTLIRQKQTELAQTKYSLEQEKQSKTQLLDKEQVEKKSLDAEKSKKNKTVSELQKKEKQLRENIKKDQAAAKKLSQQIEKIIAQEIEAARKAAAKKAAEQAKKNKKPTVTPAKSASKPKDPDAYELTPEEKKLSNSFASNRGKLPWPTEYGSITERFGTHEHELYKGVKINNDGIDITTRKGEAVRAVFDGIVMGVYPSPYGDAKTLILVHGNYRTVYSNLKSVSVKKGQKVTTKQTLGTINTYGADDKTVLKFQIWKDLSKLNPEQWISK
jgi:septal ring factor EnvC (AmiA/AmiB activator)